MSSALAIASVTALLKNLLDDGMVDDTVVGTVGNVKVSALAPDLITLAGDAPSQLNLFLYHVAANAAWRNADLPSRDERGDRRTNPPLALDLHYLVTAYASKDLHAEILLGHAMQLLHETPGLSREMIRRGLGDPGLDVDPLNLLPPELQALSTSELGEQVEAIRITPHATAADDLSKLWTALQSKFRPSVAYIVSVVLIQAKRPTRVALPVHTPKLYVETLRAPQITSLRSQAIAGGAIVSGAPILAGHRLVLRGTGLRGDRTLVRIGATTVVPDAASLEDSQVVVALPVDLRAGLQSAQVVHERMIGEPPTPHTGVASTLAAFVLRPDIKQADLQPTSDTLRLDIEPPLDPGQRAIVFLNQLQPVVSSFDPLPREYSFRVPAQTFGSPPGATNRIHVPIAGVAPGRYLVRLRVEGAESPVYRDAGGRYERPAVTVA